MSWIGSGELGKNFMPERSSLWKGSTVKERSGPGLTWPKKPSEVKSRKHLERNGECKDSEDLEDDNTIS